MSDSLVCALFYVPFSSDTNLVWKSAMLQTCNAHVPKCKVTAHPYPRWLTQEIGHFLSAYTLESVR